MARSARTRPTTSDESRCQPDCGTGAYVDCGMRAVLARIGDKWTVLVIGLLSAGPMRFNRLRAALPGISQKVLTSTLRSLERDGLVERQVRLAVPVEVSYSLTELGYTLDEPLRAVRDWSRRNFDDVEAARTRYDSRRPISADADPTMASSKSAAP
ncbi:MAG: winged helix-turn-helix transcriptional regulator [Angustibacter sp.]